MGGSAGSFFSLLIVGAVSIWFLLKVLRAPLMSKCEGCGTKVSGVATKLTKVQGRYLCPRCAVRPTADLRMQCNTCHNKVSGPETKGSTPVEIALYFFGFAPGVVYSVWRRSGPQNVCPVCHSPSLIPASEIKLNEPKRDEIECPFCAEMILAKANICKHCGKSVRITSASL